MNEIDDESKVYAYERQFTKDLCARVIKILHSEGARDILVGWNELNIDLTEYIDLDIVPDEEVWDDPIIDLRDLFQTPKSDPPKKPFEFVPYDEPPKLIGTINPEYPPFARSNGIQGRVILKVQIFKDGRVGDVTVLRTDSPLLNEAAIEAVKKAQFEPAKREGKPIDAEVYIPIDFRLDKD
ncbi:MAG: energy transducer TonB [Candidatus Cloacimonetes bacterium]|nr:energy transducer TonB [Candidatus Cloacimonadota bacterium]